MSKTLEYGDFAVTQYGGPLDLAIDWMGRRSRLRFAIFHNRNKILDLNIAEINALAHCIENVDRMGE